MQDSHHKQQNSSGAQLPPSKSTPQIRLASPKHSCFKDSKLTNSLQLILSFVIHPRSQLNSPLLLQKSPDPDNRTFAVILLITLENVNESFLPLTSSVLSLILHVGPENGFRRNTYAAFLYFPKYALLCAALLVKNPVKNATFLRLQYDKMWQKVQWV